MSDKIERFSHVIHIGNPIGTITVLYVESGMPLHVNLWAPKPDEDQKAYIERHWPFDAFENLRAAHVEDGAPPHLKGVLGKRFDHAPDLKRPTPTHEPLQVERP